MKDYKTLMEYVVNSFLEDSYTDALRRKKEREEKDIPFSNSLVLKKVKLDEKYAKEWNETSKDIVQLFTKEGKKLNDNYYRVGGISTPSPKEEYNLLLKLEESLYPDSIIKDFKRKKYLQQNWVILNREGKEIKVFKHFQTPYLYGVIYTLDNEWYNIETGKKYCKGYNYFNLDNNIIVEVSDIKCRKKYAMKINKLTGFHEIIN